MNLGELIQTLKEQGNKFISYYGIETNIESIEPATYINNVWIIKFKLKKEKK